MEKEFGALLREARERRGLALEEAAKATKIRADFLEHFEASDVSFNLPTVYQRGFVKLYAKLVRADVELVLKGFEQAVLEQERQQKKERPVRIEKKLPQPSTTKEAANAPARRSSSRMTTKGTPKLYSAKASYLKVAAVLVILGSLVIGGYWMYSGGSSDREEAVAMEAQEEAQALPVVTISGDDVRVVVRSIQDNNTIFKGTITEGNPVELDKVGPMKISFTKGEAVSVLLPNGQTMKPGREGPGWIKID